LDALSPFFSMRAELFYCNADDGFPRAPLIASTLAIKSHFFFVNIILRFASSIFFVRFRQVLVFAFRAPLGALRLGLDFHPHDCSPPPFKVRRMKYMP